MAHHLGEIIDAACAGHFLPADGGVTVVPPSHPAIETVVAFTGHAVIATALSPEAVAAQRPDGFGGAVSPHFLLWLAGEGGEVGSHDVLLAAKGDGHPVLAPRDDLEDHPRVRHARALRREVRVYGDERGLVTCGIGIGGHVEISVEVAAENRNRGIGRQLARGALGLAAEGETVVAEVAPGNAQSLRAFLAAGFTPIGSAVHVRPVDEAGLGLGHSGSKPGAQASSHRLPSGSAT